MKFIDTAIIKLKAGKGGNGAVSFRREKYVPKGGPDGGNGGAGANIYFIGDKNRHTLLDFRYKSKYSAPDGEKGRGKDQNGAAGLDLVLPVPLGTVIKNNDTNEIIGEITEDNDKILAVKGGRGGRGNTAFAGPEQRTPRIAEDGKEGEEAEISLELKLIADVGIIGFPNAGKSTFISVVSAAKPKIADYPFTTLTPNLGVVKDGHGGSFVIADMPGLIENAHEGAGLGHQFLRHIERTRLLIHFIDSSSEESLIEKYETIRNELSQYGNKTADKPEIIVLTKSEISNTDNVSIFKAYANENNLTLFEISSSARIGLNELIEEIRNQLKKENI